MGSKDVDRLSNMPEEVLSEILSLMPTKFAARTSVLSKRWRYNWTLVTSIDIDVLPFHGVENCCAFVDRVLDLCKATEIKLFRLRFSYLWVQESRMTNWITEALRRKVSELEIQCGLLDELPISFYNCRTLTKLRIENQSKEVYMKWETPFNLPCLKTLDITVYNKPSLSAFKLIRGCPVLESLSLQFSHYSNDDDIFSIPTLKRLTLIRDWKWRRCNKLVFIVPNLEDLCLDSLWCTPFEMEELPSLVSELSDARLHKVVNIQHLELKSDLSLGWEFIFRYLESCSQLEHLTIEKPRESDWIEPQTVPTCMLMNLKTIKFENCMGEKDDIQFLEYMLKNAEVLQRITITCKSGLMEEELRLCARLLKCRRASKYCEINFVGKSFNSATI